ncbi:hypothetical protein [Bacillus sp. FDAARGOS_1420]|uniref:hypothetical protein n=1 Tax=Bacillus sp. FDAARGOS_1420 TaxID=2856338 RepID=UPI001C5B279D|nr:hypothetical protein [Bacillus sp. FDAARGOS_1420]MBW3494213.1 hypothetical protein [Bacillus sp. FDAARGOS_1420]
MDNNNNQFVFHTIKSSAIKKFVIIDLITGTGIYWTVNFISSSALLAIISCVLGTKKIKKCNSLKTPNKNLSDQNEISITNRYVSACNLYSSF